MEVGHEIIQLGRHRLLCGDATNKEDVNKLLQGEVVDLLLTDAPYGISIVQPSSDGGGQIGGIGGPALRPFKRQGRTQGRSGNHTIQDKKGERERANGVQSEEANPQHSRRQGKVGISAKPSKTFTTHTHLMITKSFPQEHTNPSSTMTNPSTHNTFLTSMFPQSYSEETTSLTNSLLLTSGLYGTRNHHLTATGIISVTVN